MQINIFDLMAEAYMKAGDLPNAEKLYKEVMSKCIQSGRAEDDDSVVELSVKLASIYAIQSRNHEAETGFKFALDTMNKKLKDSGGILEADTNTLALYGLSAQSYARFLMKQKKYSEAIKHFQQSLDVAIEVYGADHPQVLVVMNDTASAHVINKDYEEGIKQYKEAVSRAERMDGAKDGLPALLYNLGEACILAKKFKEAQKYCKQCEEVSRDISNINAVKLAKQCLRDVREASKEHKSKDQKT